MFKIFQFFLLYSYDNSLLCHSWFLHHCINSWCWRQRMLPSWVSWKSKTYMEERLLVTQNPSAMPSIQLPRDWDQNTQQRGCLSYNEVFEDLVIRETTSLSDDDLIWKSTCCRMGGLVIAVFDLLVNGCYAIRWPRYQRYNCMAVTETLDRNCLDMSSKNIESFFEVLWCPWRHFCENMNYLQNDHLI